MKKKVISAGHICIDITPVIPDKGTSDIASVLKPGKLLETGRAQVSTGGSVANTGLGMKLLGADVTLMGKVGCDEFGNMICDILERYGAADGMIRSEKEATSYSVVLAVPGIDRIFLHNPGANNTFCADDIDSKVLESADHFHFGYPTLMKRMYENDGAELIALFKKVKSAGLATSLDLAAVDPDTPAGKADWERLLSGVLPYIDFFVPSIEELCFMLDRERFDNWQRLAEGRDITELIDIDEDIRPLAEKCMRLGAKTVLLKCGARGMYLRTADTATLRGGNGMGIGSKIELEVTKWADRDFFERSYKPEAVLSGTGAGDTSIAAFLTSMLAGESPEECVRMAAATGACCVSAYDALSGLKPLTELKKMIAKGWPKCS